MKSLVDDLEQLLPGRVIGPGAPRFDRYRRDMVSDRQLHRDPAAVVLPESTEDAVTLLRYADRHGVSVTPRGAASGLAGGAIAAPGGVVVSTERMNRVVEIDRSNMAAVVEPGVKTGELDDRLAPLGLFFAGYPMSEEICTIGGNVATNAGGGRAVRYGVTGAHVLGLHVVLAGGEVLHLGGKRLKDVTGLNLLPLFVGSEGTLGLITQITLRLTPRPGARRALLAAFASHAAATAAVVALRQLGSEVPAAIEYIDGRTATATAAANAALGFDDLGPNPAALLLIEADGRDRDDAGAAVRLYRDTIAHHGAAIVRSAATDAENDLLWRFRKAVPWWVKRRSGAFHSVEDVVVPPAAVPDLIERVYAVNTQLEYAVFGHAGDGNFHINPMKPPQVPEAQWEAARDEFLRALYAIAIDLGGTISGEHGIGRKRTAYAAQAIGPQVDAAAHAVKAALDPNGIMNPGVLLALKR